MIEIKYLQKQQNIIGLKSKNHSILNPFSTLFQLQKLRRWVKLKNKDYNKKQWVSTDTITGKDVSFVVKQQKDRKEKVLILTGTHGDKCGRFSPDEFSNRSGIGVKETVENEGMNPLRDEDFIINDFKLIKNYPNFSILDVWIYAKIKLKQHLNADLEDAFSQLLERKGTDVFVLGWCLSNTTQTIVNSINKLNEILL